VTEINKLIGLLPFFQAGIWFCNV